MKTADNDDIIKTVKPLNLAFFLWDQFRNNAKQMELFEKLQKQCAGKLNVSQPPLCDANLCYNLLAECDSDLIYFYSHGHTHRCQTDFEAGPNLDAFIKRYESYDKDSPQKEILRDLYESLKDKEKFEPDRSWIELRTGKVYLDELYNNRNIDLRNSKPFIFLNLCESAQVKPSLNNNSFVHFFLDRGARGVIGTECPMTIEFAHPFAEKFLTRMLEGQPVGKVLLEARRHFLKLYNPLGLAYTLYGSASVQVEPSVL